MAIGPDGRTILGEDELTVATEALKQFEPGTFALRRLGPDHVIRLLSPRLC